MDSDLNNSMVCSACFSELLVGEEFLQCMVKTCSKSYHYECTNKSLSEVEKSTWVCPECTCAAKKGGANCETPVGTPACIKNVTQRKPSSIQAPSQCSPVENITMSMPARLEIQLLREHITSLTERLTDAVSTIERYHLALTECTNKVEVVSVRLYELECHIRSQNFPVTSSPPRIPYSEVVKSPVKRDPVSGHTGSSSRGKEQSSSVNETPVNRDPVCGHTGSSARASEQSSTGKSLLNGNASKSARPFKGENSGKDVGHVPALDMFPPEQECDNPHSQDRGKKQKRLTSVRCTAGPDITSLKAVEYRKYIHLWNMVSGADEVKEYLQTLCPNGTCTVEELKSKGDYKSYKLGVPAAVYDKCLSANAWPENARVKCYFFRRPGGRTQQTQA